MELPTYEDHQDYYVRNNNIIELTSSAFQRVALEYSNPFAVGAFSVIDNYEPYERIIFIDKDLFLSPTPNNPEETFEDIKQFCIEHEISENYECLKDRIGQTGAVLTGIDAQHDEVARSAHLQKAYDAGLLDKMLEFHVMIQMTVQHRLEDQRGVARSDKPDYETTRLLRTTFAIADEIREQVT